MSALSTSRLDPGMLRGALLAAVLFDRLGVKYTVRGTELRSRVCGACGPRSRDAVSTNAATGMWCCHRCGARGDVLHLVALLHGLDIVSDFPRVKEIAAELAGITSDATSDPELVRRLDERRRADEHRRRADEADRRARVAGMPARWEALPRRSAIGEKYLERERGFSTSALRLRGDVVRYGNGDPAMALRDLETGAIVGVQYRCLVGDRKLSCEKGSQVAGAALFGKLTDIDQEGVDVAIITEGLADTLAAVLAFPGCATFGAPGAGQLAKIAAAVAPRIVAARGWLLIVADDDATGTDHASDAIVAAVSAGLTFADADAGLDGAATVRLVDIGEHHDLADAWRAGWRHEWPTPTRAS